jgi:phospholipid/cholesterol/gamma-HCH transport system substrate-binding protein
MSERGMRVGIGLFVLVALVLLGFLIVMFGSLPTYFKRSNLYTIRFVDAPGVGPGTPVRRSGVRIGEVHDVVLDDERGIVRVRVAIDPRFTLRRNEQPTLNIGLLGSDVSIDFVPEPTEEGQPVDRTVLEPGSEIVGVRPANVNTLLNRASEVAPTAQDTLNEIRRSLQRLDKLAPVADETMREYRDLAKDIRRNIPELERTNKEYQDLAKDVRRTIPNLERTNQEIQDLAKDVRRTIPNLERTSQEVQDLAKDVRRALPGVQRDLDDFGTASRNWSKLGERLDVWAQGNLENLTRVIENLNTALTRIGNAFSEENVRNLNTILKNTSTASQRFESITRNLDGILEDSRPLPKHVNDTLSRMDVTMEDTRKTEDELRKTFAPYTARSESTSRNLDESMAKLNRMLTDLSGLKNVLDQDGTVQRLLKDPSLYNNLNDAACLILRSMPRLDRMLRDFETFADKLARHPELLGVRGAVRPSDGLKEPPKPFNQPIVVPGGPP